MSSAFYPQRPRKVRTARSPSVVSVCDTLSMRVRYDAIEREGGRKRWYAIEDQSNREPHAVARRDRAPPGRAVRAPHAGRPTKAMDIEAGGGLPVAPDRRKSRKPPRVKDRTRGGQAYGGIPCDDGPPANGGTTAAHCRRWCLLAAVALVTWSLAAGQLVASPVQALTDFFRAQSSATQPARWHAPLRRRCGCGFGRRLRPRNGSRPPSRGRSFTPAQLRP